MNKKQYFSKNQKSTSERLKMKRRLVDFLGGKCIDCGYSAHLAALEFDHVVPSKKKYNISRGIGVCDYLVLLEEVRKCVLRCSNCHRIKTNPQATD